MAQVSHFFCFAFPQAHVPVENFNFKMKAVYLALMVRRIIEAQNDPTMVDDRWVSLNKKSVAEKT